MKAKQPKITPALKSAYDRWLKGERRKSLATELNVARPALRQAFVVISGLKWKDLVAKRGGAKKQGKKSAKKEAPQQARRAA